MLPIQSTNELATVQAANQASTLPLEVMQNWLLKNDVNGLTKEQQVEFLLRLYSVVGVAPETGSIILMDFRKTGKLVPYPTDNFASNMRAKHSISLQETFAGVVQIGEFLLYEVKYRAISPDGRFTDEGAILTLPKVDASGLADAIMKVRTKAARRTTLKHLGMAIGLIDAGEWDGNYQSGQMSPEEVEARMVEDKAPTVKRPSKPATDESKATFVALLDHPSLAPHKQGFLDKIGSWSEKELKEKIGLAQTTIANYEAKQTNASV